MNSEIEELNDRASSSYFRKVIKQFGKMHPLFVHLEKIFPKPNEDKANGHVNDIVAESPENTQHDSESKILLQEIAAKLTTNGNLKNSKWGRHQSMVIKGTPVEMTTTSKDVLAILEKAKLNHMNWDEALIKVFKRLEESVEAYIPAFSTTFFGTTETSFNTYKSCQSELEKRYTELSTAKQEMREENLGCFSLLAKLF